VVSSTNKTDCHSITEILLKVALNTIKPNQQIKVSNCLLRHQIHIASIYLICISVPLPCIVTDWSNWSAPDSTGVRFRYRYMTRPSLNGGKECPDLMQLGKGMASTKIVE
jgi:hypothetical protein